MVKFIDVDPDEIPNLRESHRGRVSYPILKSFLETGKTLAQLDRTGIQQNLQSLSSSLNAYIRSHELPIKMFTRKGEIFLARTDVDDEGKSQPLNIATIKPRYEVAKAPQDLLDDDSIPGIDEEEVEARFQVEKGQVTK